jgi:hypothetical protein
MIQSRWDGPQVEDDDQTWPEQPSPTLVSLHFIRSALRRRWLVCALSAVSGLLMAVGFLVVFNPHSAKATLALMHEEGVDPSLAMSTDVGLLRSQAVAAKTIAHLGLTMTPDGFINSVTVEQVSTDLLSMTLAAPTDEEAVRRLAALTLVYLDFRGEQLSMQSDVLVAATQQRIQNLEAERTALSRRVDQLVEASGSEASKLSETIAQRAYIQSQIDDLHKSIEDANLRSFAVVASSRVIDPAAVAEDGGKRRIVLVLVSGLIGGAALGCGMVLFFAITSDRLRRRSEVAEAVEAPVRVSVRRIAPIPERWLWAPHMRTLDGSRADDRHRLAHVVEMELPVPRERGRLAVACTDNADEVRFAVATAAIDLAAEGLCVALVDLTKRGGLDIQLMSSLAASAAQPTVLRPHGMPPELAVAADLRVIGHEQDKTPSLELYDVVLVLADLDPSVGADHLTAWTDRVIFVVTSGRSSAERLRTAADLVRTVGLDLRFVALLHTERTDDSMGRSTMETEQADTESADHVEQRLAESQPAVGAAQLEAAGEQRDIEDVQTEAALGANGQVAVLEQCADLQIVSEEHLADIEIAPEEHLADIEIAPEEHLADIEIAPEEHLADIEIAPEEHLADIEIAPEEQPTEAQAAEEEQTGTKVSWPPDVEEQQAFDERVAADEQPAVGEGTDKELSARAQGAADEQLIDEEQGNVLEEQPAEEEEGHTPETEPAAEPDQALKPPEEEAAVDGQHVDIAAEPLAHVSSASNSEDGDFDWSWERSREDPDTQLPIADGWHVDIAESPQAPVSSPSSSEPDGLNWNPAWSFDDPGSNLDALDGWPLYIDEYPQAYIVPAPGTEDEEVDWDRDLCVRDSNQDSAVVATEEEADGSSDERAPTTTANGETHRLVPGHREGGSSQNGTHPVGDGQNANSQAGNRRSGNGQISSGRERQRTKTRNRRRRSRPK